ncbi:hypothetical protein [Anaerotruncus colihominis]|uniref:hypothetical protein n=1 Tax=Anaerotruncus colihominis TaxID=169435 RepID=UPI00242B0F04|nr:hypothetical protein [Anaerotruncus colihominis]
MAWVSVHDNVIGGKLRELAKEIGCTQEEALGILVSLWLWGLNNADKDGKLMSADKEDVLEAFSARLVGNLKVDIVDTLVKTRWMEEPEPGVLYIHDWDQWQEQWYKAMERREKDAKRKAESRKRKSAVRTSPADAVKKAARTPEPKPDSTEGTTPVKGEEAQNQPEAPKYAPPFEAFWSAYPRKVDKGEAYKKYRARRNDGYSDEELFEAAKAYALQCKKQKTDKQYIKHPKTFLSDSLPFLDFLPKKTTPPEAQVQQNGNPFDEWGDEN